MKAFAVSSYGPASPFVEIDLPDPGPAPGRVVIEVAASSVNPVDTKIRAGGRDMCPPLPAVLHMDVAGTVVAVGGDVRNFRAGDEVFGCAGGLRTVSGEVLQGALADYMVADARLIARKPESLDLVEAAALPLVAITAWEGLCDRARVGPGDRVLVHGGAGGVGHVAIQIAAACGAIVDATVSSDRKAGLARELGAAEVIRYRDEAVDDYVQRLTTGLGYDVVLDTVGGPNLETSMAATRVGGQTVTILAGGEHDLTGMHARGLTLAAVFMLLPMLHDFGRERHGEILGRVAALVDHGRLRPLIDPRRHPFAEAHEAHRRLEAGDAVGKIVLIR
jgi:NADPH2:quinone reductase